jgi:WD40 repeat protein
MEISKIMLDSEAGFSANSGPTRLARPRQEKGLRVSTRSPRNNNPMKTNPSFRILKFSTLVPLGIAIAAALCLIPVTGRAQIFVTNLNNNTIGEYNATTGATINSSFISSGLSFPFGIALSGGNLFVANVFNSTIGEYNATTGATINSSFISSGLNGPEGIALSGGNLFVANVFNSTIGEYNATTGATINSSFISSGLNEPVGIVVSSPSSVPDASPTLILLLLGIGATFGLNLLLHKRSKA